MVIEHLPVDVDFHFAAQCRVHILEAETGFDHIRFRFAAGLQAAYLGIDFEEHRRIAYGNYGSDRIF